jgi:MFS family permease
LLLALTPGTATPVAVLLLGAAAVVLTLGELLESPSWWTVSYELAPVALKDEYLAAFDLSWALVTIVGPASMAGIVAFGSTGWVVYGVVLLLAAVCGSALIRRRVGRATKTEANPSNGLIGVTQE